MEILLVISPVFYHLEGNLRYDLEFDFRRDKIIVNLYYRFFLRMIELFYDIFFKSSTTYINYNILVNIN